MKCHSSKLLLVALLLGHALAQPPAVVQVQSFRKGPTTVPEQNMVVNLSAESPRFESKIRDSAGDERYQLTIAPQWVDVQDHRVVAWQVRLLDLHRGYLGNLLVATGPTEPLSERAEDRAWRLDPDPYAPVPLMAKRVIKVEGFYCTIEVKDRSFLSLDRRLLRLLKAEVSFGNVNPAVK